MNMQGLVLDTFVGDTGAEWEGRSALGSTGRGRSTAAGAGDTGAAADTRDTEVAVGCSSNEILDFFSPLLL